MDGKLKSFEAALFFCFVVMKVINFLNIIFLVFQSHINIFIQPFSVLISGRYVHPVTT